MDILTEFYYSQSKNKSLREKALQSKGLGIRISTLVGSASENIIRASIARDYPDNEQVDIAQNERRDEILEVLDQELPARPKPILKYKKVSDFLKTYARTIEGKRKSEELTGTQLARMPWRGNPFR